jgi:hypothetical protein
MLVLQDCMDSQQDAPETCPPSSLDADHSVSIKVEEVSDVEVEEDPLLISSAGIEAEHAVSCFISVLTEVEAEIEAKLRPTVSRPVRLGVRHPSGTHDQFFFLLEIFFRQLRVCYFVAPSLTRGRICILLLLLVLAISVPRD